MGTIFCLNYSVCGVCVRTETAAGRGCESITHRKCLSLVQIHCQDSCWGRLCCLTHYTFISLQNLREKEKKIEGNGGRGEPTARNSVWSHSVCQACKVSFRCLNLDWLTGGVEEHTVCMCAEQSTPFSIKTPVFCVCTVLPLLVFLCWLLVSATQVWDEPVL